MISLNRTTRAGAAAFAALAVAAPIAQARPAALTAKQQEKASGAPVNQTHPAKASHRNELVLGSPAPQPRTIVRVVHSDGSGADFTDAAIGAASAMGVILVAGAVTSARRRRIALP